MKETPMGATSDGTTDRAARRAIELLVSILSSYPQFSHADLMRVVAALNAES